MIASECYQECRKLDDGMDYAFAIRYSSQLGSVSIALKIEKCLTLKIG
jgi:hypothetical protein